MVPVTAPSPEAAARFVADFKRLSAGTPRDRPTQWVSGMHRAFARKVFFVRVAVLVVVIVVLYWAIPWTDQP
jgi:hypothetical protein